MAHEIESMFSVQETPWHKLGKVLPEAPSAEDALRCAGLDWTVSLTPLFTDTGVRVTHQAVRRDSDGRVLGVVGPQYQPLQNAEALAFFDPFVQAGEATYETAGSLREGSRVWILAALKRDPLVIVPRADDTVKKYLLLSNSHDGIFAARVGFTPVRVVCANTLSMAITNKRSSLIRVRHTSAIVSNLEALRETIDLANAEFEATAEQFRTLAAREINSEDLKKYVRQVFFPRAVSPNPDMSVADDNKGSRILAKVIPLFEQGRGNNLPGVRGTLWAAYNAVTEYLSHERGRTPDGRLENLWFGDSVGVNQRALEVGLQMAA